MALILFGPSRFYEEIKLLADKEADRLLYHDFKDWYRYRPHEAITYTIQLSKAFICEEFMNSN